MMDEIDIMCPGSRWGRPAPMPDSLKAEKLYQAIEIRLSQHYPDVSGPVSTRQYIQTGKSEVECVCVHEWADCDGSGTVLRFELFPEGLRVTVRVCYDGSPLDAYSGRSYMFWRMNELLALQMLVDLALNIGKEQSKENPSMFDQALQSVAMEPVR